MVGKKISALPVISAPALTDIIPDVQPATSGITYKMTLQQLLTLYLANLGVLPAANGATGVANPTIHTLPVAQGASAFNFLTLTNGQLLIGSTGADPIPATLTGGTGISISNAAGVITISTSGSGVGWVNVTGTSQAMTSNNGYVSNNAALVTLTLPTTSSLGDIIYIEGEGAGGWSIAQGAGQYVNIGSVTSTVGAGGSVESTHRRDSAALVCIVANLGWSTLGAPQSAGLTIV